MTRRRRGTAAAFALAILAAGSVHAGGLASEHEQALYAIGVRLGRSLAPFALAEGELAVVLRGLSDTVLGRELAVNETALQARIDALREQRRAAASEAERAASAAFLERAAREPGAVRMDSGLVFLELRAGAGPAPALGDRVRIHYHGRLRDGNAFDSSVERGSSVQLALANALPCWREGLLRMRVGGKSRLACPAALAHGPAGDPPRVAGGAAVSYEIELLEIVAR
jgi:FKBP-type peptidyl-prolyl cis-trans isomerase